MHTRWMKGVGSFWMKKWSWPPSEWLCTEISRISTFFLLHGRSIVRSIATNTNNIGMETTWSDYCSKTLLINCTVRRLDCGTSSRRSVIYKVVVIGAHKINRKRAGAKIEKIL
jgi:hypothetical protein